MQDFDADAIDAVRQIAGVNGKHALRAVQGWDDDPLEAARSLAVGAAGNAELGQALDAIIGHFDAAACFATQLTSLYEAQWGGDVSNIVERIQAALVNVGGVTNIQSLTLQVAPAAPPQAGLPVSPPPEPTRPPEIREFVGREMELTAFARRLAGEHLAVITGMAGVGKTALAAALAGIWTARQMNSSLDGGGDGAEALAGAFLSRETGAQGPVFWHSFHQGEGVMTLIWKLAGFLYWRGQGDLWRLLQGAQQTGGQPPPPDCLFDYALQMLRGRGYLLCLDDVRWVEDDPLLAQFVQRLEGLIQAGEAVLILTSRRVPHYLRLDGFEPLGGLNLAGTARLVKTRGLALSETLVDKLRAHTGGNPGLLSLAINVLKGAIDPGHYLMADDDTLRRVIKAREGADKAERALSRLAEADDIERYLIREVDERLGDDERAVLMVVAVLLGYPGSRETIEAVSAQTVASTDQAKTSARELATIAGDMEQTIARYRLE